MKKTKRILVTVLLVLLVGAVWAQKPQNAPGKIEKAPTEAKAKPATPPDAPPPPPPPPPDEQMEQEFPAPMPLHLPDLTDVQKEKIKQSNLKNLQAITPIKNQIRAKKAKLNTVLTTQPVNVAEADQLADELGKLGASIMKQMIRHDQEIRSFLTPDQQIIFDSRPKPFLDRMGPMMSGKKVKKEGMRSRQ